jgi:hypothetical protein
MIENLKMNKKRHKAGMFLNAKDVASAVKKGIRL